MSFKALLDELKKDYIATLPEKIENIRTLWQAGNLEELHSEYHKMKGTGRTYGIPEVSQLGEALETLCEAKTPDAHEVLSRAVPMSLTILGKIRDSRLKDTALNIEDDRDFRVIVEFVMSLPRSA